MLLLALTSAPAGQNPQPSPMSTIAERYVKLVVALGSTNAIMEALSGRPGMEREAARKEDACRRSHRAA